MVLASACMIGPDFKRPAAAVGSKWLESGNRSINTARNVRSDNEDWWTLFKDPVLTNLIQIAYRQNLTLLTAGVRVLEARAQLGIAIGEFYPQQQLATGTLTYNRIPLSNFNLITNTYWADQLGAQSIWELDLWGKFRRGVQSADNSFLASVADYDDVLVTLTGDVASSYVQIRTTQRQIEIARENVERQREALQIAQARFNEGVATGRDVDQATNVLGTTEASVPQLEIQLKNAQDALCVLLGRPPGTADALLAAGAADIPKPPEQVAVGIPADLLRRRPDIRSAELQAAAQSAQIGFSKADLLPAFYLTGSVGTLATNAAGSSLGDIFKSNTLLFSVGPSVQWNILNYGQITNNVRVQDAKFQELIAGYQNAVLKAQQEVEDGLTLFINSRAQVEFFSTSVAAATDAFTISLLQYKEGTADFTTVLTAEQNLLQAQNDLAVARGAVPLGLIATYRAMGGGWQLREGHDFVPAPVREEMAKRTNWGKLLSPQLLQPQAPGLPLPRDAGSTVRPPEW